MNQKYGGCGNDAGWLVVLEQNDVCPWGKLAEGEHSPVILYSKLTTHVTYQSGKEDSELGFCGCFSPEISR